MEWERCFLMVPLTMSDVVALSQWMGIGGFGWPSSAKLSQIVRPSFTFMNVVPNYASESDDATNFKMLHRV